MSASPTERRPSSDLKRLSALIAVSGIDMIGFAIVLPLLPFYAMELKATPIEIGCMLSSYSVAQLLAAPMWGRVSDRYGRRPALLIGLTASAAAYVVFGLANQLWLLFASRIVQGAGGGTTGVAQAYVADTIRPADRARALGWLSAATSAGVAAGPALGAFATHLSPRAPGFLAAGFCLLNIVFAWRWLPESRPAVTDHGPRKPVLRAALRIAHSPRAPVSRMVLIYAVGMLAFTCMTSVVALFLNAKFGVTENTIGYFFLYTGLLSFVMRSLILGPVVDRLGEVRTMRTGRPRWCSGWCCTRSRPRLWILFLVIPLVPIGTALLFPATTSILSHLAPAAELGTTMGVAQSYAGLSRIVAPLIATAAFQHLGQRAPFFVAAGLVVLVSLLAFRVEHGTRPAASPTDTVQASSS
jgi:multidrug resistance protein